MRTRIVRIGDSRGTRIPKPLLEQAGLDGDVDLVLEDGVLIVKPVRACEGWDAAFQAMAEEGADRSLDASDGTRAGDEESTWCIGARRASSRYTPPRGAEIRKTRPCLIVSPDEMNRHIRTVLIAPMTTGGRAYPTRVPVRFRRRGSLIARDQLRAVDKERWVTSLGSVDEDVQDRLIAVPQEMFAC